MDRTKRILRYFFDQFREGADATGREHRRVGLNVYGGEPLFEWKDLQETVLWLRDSDVADTVDYHVGIVSNMVLLDEKKLDWLIEHKVSVHPSIDGNAQAEDTQRIFPDGSGCSHIVYDNARRLLDRMGGRSCRMTVTPQTVPYVYDSIVFLCEDIGFPTVNPILAGGIKWKDDALEAFKAQITKVTDWWIDKMRQGEHYSLYHIRNMLMGLWSGQRRRGLCSSGVSRVGIDTEGNLWPCHRFCNLSSDPHYCLGNIETGYTNMEFYNKLRSYDLAQAHKDRCKNCPAVLGCHAICMHESMIEHDGKFALPASHYCKVWPFYWSEALRAHTLLTAEKNEQYVKLYDSRSRQLQRQRSSMMRKANERMRDMRDKLREKQLELRETQKRVRTLEREARRK
jgi:radical SAM protein with 4Fe4S-binding SPASM domain